MKRKEWTRELVIEQILSRYTAELPINSADVAKEDEPLSGAGRRLFGSWGEAVAAAGLDYNTVKLEAARRPRNPPGTWDAEQVIKAVKKRAHEGLPMNAHSVQADDSPLYSAAVGYLGSWGKAVEAAGIDYLEHRKTTEWDKDKLTEKIRSLHEAGADLSDRNVNLLAPPLYGAAMTHYRSWPAAIEAAGLSYEEVSRTERWSRAKLRAYALQLLEKGVPVTKEAMPYAYVDYYDSIGDLLQDLELAADKHKPTPNLIQQHRNRHGMTQRELGSAVGRSHTWISFLELGRVEPTISEALLLARALGVKIEDVFCLAT